MIFYLMSAVQIPENNSHKKYQQSMLPNSQNWRQNIILFITGILILNLFSCIKTIGPITLSNENFKIYLETDSGEINVQIIDKLNDIVWAEGAYEYSLDVLEGDVLKEYRKLEIKSIKQHSDTIRIHGEIGGFIITHDLIVPKSLAFFEEEMQITNPTERKFSVVNFSSSFGKKVIKDDGSILDEFRSDHFQAIPFLHRSDDTPNFSGHDYSLSQIMEGDGFVYQTSELTWNLPKREPSKYFVSEGWGWRHEDAILGIFSFNQENMILSTLSGNSKGNLCFGGFNKSGLNLSALEQIEGLATVYLGKNRFYSLQEGYNQATYKYREMLDELGCRFPSDYDPPVHWNAHYSPELENAWKYREIYTKDLILEEARKAKEYSCQALYLDPGWDSDFGSFLWAEERLGSLKTFVEIVKDDYGLKTSLHTPLSPWTTNEALPLGPVASTDSWPEEAKRWIPLSDTDTLDTKKSITKKIIQAAKGPQICLASQQYLDEAEKRLLNLCKSGVTFLMFDGTYWNGECVQENHGHPIPLLYEDQMKVLTELTQRIHAVYPEVLIEMHDMLNGGHWTRCTPVYYKYGLEGSYDENWGFELMWKPFEHLRDKTALAMYYYNLGCNIPLYLHVDLGVDNENSLVFWWYASTARHLGIGSSNNDVELAKQHHQAMNEYIRFQDYFKIGEFWGIHEEIHLHTLNKEQKCLINIFNLSDSAKITEGSISMEEIGLNPETEYISDKKWVTISNGRIEVSKEMKPWDTDKVEIQVKNKSNEN